MDGAIILAAGRGEKIWPYGVTRPKAALPLANAPILTHLTGAIRANGAREITVVAAPSHEAEIRAIAGGAPGVRIVEQAGGPGTAAAILSGWRSGWEEALVVAGDLLLLEEDLRALLARHAAHDDPVTALVAPIEDGDPQSWSVAHLEGDRIRSVRIHPREGETRLAGAYALRRAFLAELERTPAFPTCLDVGVMPPEERDVVEAIHRRIQAAGPVPAAAARGPFADIDKPWHLLEATEKLLAWRSERLRASEIDPAASVAPEARIEGHVVAEAGARIGPGVRARGNVWLGRGATVEEGAILGRDCAIGPEARVWGTCLLGDRTAVGARAVVGHGAEFEGILMDGAYAYHYGEFWGIVGRDADLGAATVCGTLRFDDRATIHRVRGRREIPRTHANAIYLGDYTRTGVGAILMPGVKVGPWSVVGPGVVLSEDLPERTLIYQEQKLVRRPWGPERYGF